MSGHYVLKEFLRQAPSDLLCEYLKKKGLGDRIDWSDLPGSEVEVFHKLIHSADKHVFETINADFEEIQDMSDSSGIVTFIDVGRNLSPPVDLVEVFAPEVGNVRKSFIVFLNYPEVFSQAHKAEDFCVRRSSRLTGMPELPEDWDHDACCEQVRTSMSEYYQETEGRGENSEVDCEEIGGKHYWFVYLENYPDFDLGFDDSKKLGPQMRRPVFRISCRYDERDRTMEIAGVTKEQTLERIRDIFTTAIFGIEFKNVGVRGKYQLKHLIAPDHRFDAYPELGVAACKLKSVKLNARGRAGLTLQIGLGGDCSHGHLQECVDSFMRAEGIAFERVHVKSVRLQIMFVPDPGRQKGRTLTFSVNDLASTDLKSDKRSEIARECLKRWEIDTNSVDGDGSSESSRVGQTVIRSSRSE
jgi:hypothetical protein